MTIRERIISGRCEPLAAFMPAIEMRTFASTDSGATAMSTGSATFAPAACLPYHEHPFSEAATVLEGEALFSVEGRTYRLSPLDCIHIPAAVAHQAVNASDTKPLVVLWALASPTPSRELVSTQFSEKLIAGPALGDPEHIVRFRTADTYVLAPGNVFCDLFAGRHGSVGICGGYGVFQPGSSLPCHFHDFDESITIIEGEATCQVAGRRYRLSGCDTAFIPRRKPHRFLNDSSKPMAMVWVYAGSEPSRSIVDAEYCDGSLQWADLS